MNADRVRCAKISRMTEHRQPGRLAIDPPVDMAPSGVRFVAVRAVLRFRGEENAVVLSIPVPMPAKGHSSIMIFREDERILGGAFLCRNQVEHEVWFRAFSHVVCNYLPDLVERGLRSPPTQVYVAVTRPEAGIDRSAPGFVERDEFDRPAARAHIPEIRLVLFEPGFGPGEPDAVMMQMVWWVIIGNDATGRRINGVNVPATLENRLDIVSRQLTLTLISEGLPPGDIDRDFLLLTD